MSVRGLRKAALVAIGLVGMVAVNTASAASFTAITALAATPSTSTIAVIGKATFSNGAMVVAPDATDATAHGKVPGSNLTSGSIALSDNNRELIFTLEVANMADELLPNVFYTWPLKVDEIDNKYFLLAAPAGLAASQTPTTDPFFDLKSVGSNGFTQVASLTGTIGGGKVTWNVPLSVIGAKFGSSITMGTTAANRPGVGTGVGGAAQTYGTLDIVDTVDEYVVPGQVSVGIAPATTPDNMVALTTPATIKTSGASTGTFTAQVPRPAQAGSYKVVARACSTDGDCVIQSTPLTL